MITEGLSGVGVVDKNTFVFSDIPSKPIIPVILTTTATDSSVCVQTNRFFISIIGLIDCVFRMLMLFICKSIQQDPAGMLRFTP